MKKAELIFSTILVPVDYLMIVLATMVAYSLRFTKLASGIRPIIFSIPFAEYLFLVLMIAIGWLIIFAITKLYTITGQRRLIDEIAKIFVACSASIAGVIILIFFGRESFASRFIILAIWLFSFIFVSIGRVIIRKIQRYFYKHNYGVHHLVVIGRDRTSDLISAELNNNKSLGYKVVQQVAGFNQSVKEIFDRLLSDNLLDEILVADLNLDKESSLDLINYCQEHHIGFKYATDIFKNQTSNMEIGIVAGIPIIELKETRLDGWGRIGKRFFDLVVSFFLIILFLPCLLLVAILIKLDSAGPIFFGYDRVGERGRKFKYFKFRSMIDNAHQKRFDPQFLQQVANERAGTPLIKFKDDPRITKIGKLLRRTSLDELPELLNVFIGKMSLVGPRPHEVEEVAKYERHHKKVLAIKPGMTGLAQISGRSDLNFEEEVKLDTFYINNWSLKLDLWILFKTPLTLFKKRKTI